MWFYPGISERRGSEVIKMFKPLSLIGRIVYPIVISLGIVYYIHSKYLIEEKLWSSGYIPAFSISLLVVRVFFDEFALSASKKKSNKSAHQIHCKYAISKINHVKSILDNASYDNTTRASALKELEAIIGDICKCCMKKDRKRFKGFKGIIAGYKNDLEVSKHDKRVKPKISNLILDLNQVETYLNDYT